MKARIWTSTLLAGAALLWWAISPAGPAHAQSGAAGGKSEEQGSHQEQGLHEGHQMQQGGMSGDMGGESPGRSLEMCELHGGMVTMTQDHHFETLFTPDGVRVYMYSGKQVPARFRKAAGKVTLESANGQTSEVPLVPQAPAEGEPTVYFCPMHAQATQWEPGKCQACGGMTLMAQNYLQGKVDLSSLEPGTMKAVVHITDLAGDEPEVTFTETFPGMMKLAPHRDGMKANSEQGMKGQAAKHGMAKEDAQQETTSSHADSHR